jgi:alkyl hydroperoxide reductase subunit AhpC
MESHGDYEITIIDDVVHVFPTGGFNEQGICDLRERILTIAPKDKSWGLFEHPRDLAGLTPDALEEILKSYQAFIKINCQVIALEANSTWQGVIEKKLKGNLSIPFYLGDNEKELASLINQHLED